MKEYEDFVAGQFATQRGKGCAGEVFQNRNKDHAKVVIPYLFRGAESWVHLLTRRADEEVYSAKAVIGAAVEFLDQHPDGRIEFLAETPINRSSHPFFLAIDAEQSRASRTTLRVVPEDAQKHYACNFGVNDQGDYRLEPSRNNQEAMVQFGCKDFAIDLDRVFQDLNAASAG